MYETKPFKPKVRLWAIQYTVSWFNNKALDGSKRQLAEFETIDIAVKTIMSWRPHPDYIMYSLLHPKEKHVWWGTDTVTVRYELIDQYGDLVPISEFKPLHDRIEFEQNKHNRRRYRWARKHPYLFRNGAVPGTGIRRRRWCYRGTNLIGEHRANDWSISQDDPENGIYIRIRAKRRPQFYPYWEDCGGRSRCGFGWKNFRDTQWKG